MDPREPGSNPLDGADRSPAGERLVFVTVIVKPFRVEPVLISLEPFRVRSLAITEVRGYGRQKGHLELYKGSEYAISFIPKVKVELAIPEAEVEPLIAAVSRSARTGRIGDGKVFLQGCDVIDLDAPGV